MSGTSGEDDAWRAIVENYGERVEVDDEPTPSPAPPQQPEPYAPTLDEVDRDVEVRDRFVPPDPGPGPRLELPRHLPWLAVFGAPALLVLALMAGVPLPTWLGYLMVASFVGGFLYLVMNMQRGGRDPFDDGAQV